MTALQLNRKLDLTARVLQIILVAILVQDILAKLIGTPQVVYIYERLAMGGFGRYASLIIEAVCVVGLLVPRLYRQGAVLTIAVMTTGLFFHLTELGIRVYADSGLRFYLTVAGLVLAIIVLLIRNHLALVLFRNGRL